jgi:hypothetical protein
VKNVQGSGRGLICDWPNNSWSRDRVLGVLTKVEAGRPGTRVSIPDTSKSFVSSNSRPDLDTLRYLCSVGIGVPLSESKTPRAEVDQLRTSDAFTACVSRFEQRPI